MRAGNLYHRINFYSKLTTRDDYGASSDSWPVVTISTKGELRWTGGNKGLSNEEKFYSKSMELTVRYRNDIIETMKVQIDNTNDLYAINYIEILGRNEGLRMSLEKLNDGLPTFLDSAPSDLLITYTTAGQLNLFWTNNIYDDAVVLERSLNGSLFTIIHTTQTGIETYIDSGLTEDTRYYYRIRSKRGNLYSNYTPVEYETTGIWE